MFRLIVIAICFISNLSHAHHTKLQMQEAIDRKLIKTSVASLGGHQGFCIRLTVENLTKDSLLIVVEAGRRFNSVDDKQQDILVVKQEELYLKSRQVKTQKIKGYCCQLNNSSPEAGAKYTVNKLADSTLYLLANYLNGKNFETMVEQNAIWAISNNRPTATITGKNDSILCTLRQIVATLKNEPIPWYTLICSNYTYSNGVIGVFPGTLHGELTYSADNFIYTTCNILNEKGVPVILVKQCWLPPGSNQNYPLDLDVRGLEKGKYTVELKGNDQMLASRNFVI